MTPTKILSLFFLGISMTACLPDSRRSSLDSLRTAAMNEAQGYAFEMGPYAANHSEEQAKEKAMESVKRQLKDPDSAKFQNVRLIPHPNGKVACGDVNAKNSFGGYVGFRKFIAGTTGAAIEDIDRRHLEISAASNAGITSICGY